MDNLDVEILFKVNDLAARHGLRATDFRAIFVKSDERMNHVLRFTWPADDTSESQKKYHRLLTVLGVPRDSNELEGSAEHILDRLDRGLALAAGHSRKHDR